MLAWLLACGGGRPEAWIGVDQAVVTDGGGLVADVSATRTAADGTRVRKTDRCHLSPDGATRGCVLPPAGRTTLSRVGDLLVDERVGEGDARSLAILDPATLADLAVIPAGLASAARVVGGSIWAGPDGLLELVVTHGLASVETDDGGPAAWTVEAWRAGDAAPAWRRGLGRFPDQVLRAHGLLLVHANGLWRAIEEATGEVRWERPAEGGACVGDGSLWVAEEGEVRAFPLAGGEPRSEPWTPPGPVSACAWWRGAPLFHGGGMGDGDGWLGAPGFAPLRVPRVDLELGDHVDGDRLWVHELGRGLVIVEPERRRVEQPLEVHDVVRLGDHLGRYAITADERLAMTLATDEGTLVAERQVSPRPWHVDGDTLFTFAAIADRPEDLVRRWRLPELAPVR